MKQWVKTFVWVVALILSGQAWAMQDVILTITQHRFVPAIVTLPANTKVRLIVKNQDPTPEEFDSAELHREKIIPGNGQGIVFIGPLPPGRYAFMGEFHQATARGHIVVK